MSDKEKRINEEDLLVGEANAMRLATGVWSVLSAVKPSYLKSVIQKLEEHTGLEMAQDALPIFKLILFFATELQAELKRNPKLVEAIEEAQIKHRLAQAFGVPSPLE
jgi:hypothetical protein